MKASRTSVWVWLFVAVLAGIPLRDRANAAERRALLIGINTYKPEGTEGGGASASPAAVGSSFPKEATRKTWTNLKGAVNDVVVMREILVSRFGFARANIIELTDREATRERILLELRRHLLENIQPGDVCVFYYAGHGSQVRNSRSDEADGLDETIVPADAHLGVPDIRDKELRRIFNEILDRGGVLTCFFDSCKSGSVSRGLLVPTTDRFLEADARNYALLTEGENLPPDPATRGALVFTASQEFQAAKEMNDDAGTRHGVFSLALEQTIREMPVDAPADRVFSSVRARMQSAGRTQEPMIHGTETRRDGALFGGKAGGSRLTTVAVQSVSPDGTCELQGGIANGLCVGAELRTQEASNIPLVRVRIESVEDLSRSVARVIKGSSRALQPGTHLELDRWAACDVPLLRVWIPDVAPTEELREVIRLVWRLESSDRIEWISDPTEEPKKPSRTDQLHVLWWENGRWRLSLGGRELFSFQSITALGEGRSNGGDPILTREGLLKHLVVVDGKKPRLFVWMPPPAGLQLEQRERAIEAVDTPENATYLLAGRVRGGRLEYAWVLPNATRSEIVANTLPVRTSWVSVSLSKPLSGDAPERLQTLALRLGKIRTWMQLESPPDDGGFPCTLILRDRRKGALRANPTLYDGDSCIVVLQLDLDRIEQQRYVYLFAVNSEGKQTLLYPTCGDGNKDNYLPRQAATGGRAEAEVRLLPVYATKPYGTDTLILLTTREAIPDPCVLESEGVVMKRKEQKMPTPLELLLGDISAGVRGLRQGIERHWSLQRLTVRTAARRHP